ncbi:MAG: PAS domain-containing protein [Planctomycetales bacterium]|nr:PAS domain-containing protein [Planctomycetales bacterium]
MRIAGTYLLAGVAWILLSDMSLVWTGVEDLRGYLISASKGVLFVTASALLIYLLLKRHVRRVQRANALAWGVIDGTTDAVFVKGRDGRYLMFNEAAARAAGYPAAEILGKTDAEIFGPEAAAEIRLLDERVMSTGCAETVEDQLGVEDEPRTYLTRKSPLRGSSGEVVGLIGIARDITRRKRAEQQLQDQRDRLERIMEAVPAIICSYRLDPDGKLTIPFASSGLEELLGIDLSDLAEDATPALDRVHPDDRERVLASVAESARSLSLCHDEYRVCDATGREIWVESCYSPQHLPNGSVLWHGYVADVTKRRKTAEALLHTEELLREARRVARLGNWSWNCATEELWWSESTYELLGFDSSVVEPSFEALYELLEPVDREVAQSHLASVKAGEIDSFEKEFRLRRADGKTIWIHSVCWATRDDNGRLLRVAGFDQDVTDRKAALEKLSVQEERLRLALAGAGGGAWDWDLASQVAWWSPEMYDMWGVQPGTVMELESSLAAIHEDDRESIREASAAAIAQDVLYRAEFRIHHPTRGLRWILSLGRIVHGSDGRPARMVGISVDVTDRKQMVEDLRQQDERLRLALAGAKAAVWDWHLETQDAWWSPEMFALWGKPPSDRRVPLAELIPRVVEEDRDALRQSIQRTTEMGADFECEIRITHPQRGVRWLSCFGRLQHHAESKERRMVGITFDVTERKHAEEDRRQLELQILRSQKLESLGLMAGGIAHDFNNLLTAVIGNVVLAQMHLPDDSPAEAWLNEVEMVARRAASLTKQLLSYAGGSVSQFTPVRLDWLVADLTDLLRSVIAKTTTLNLDLQPATAEGDADQLRQVVMNLLTNASEALEGEPGVVTVSTGVRRLEAEQLAERPTSNILAASELAPGEFACLQVQDNGCGMTDEVRSRILDPFFTTKLAGRGLGLAAVAGIVRSHNGALAVDSVPNQQTTFAIYLPCSHRKATSPYDQGSPAKLVAGAAHSGELLVVEDDPAVRGYIRRALVQAGYEVHTAEDGRAGLQKFADLDASRLKLVIVDFTMPGLDGGQVRDHIREAAPQLPVLLMSGYGQDVLSEPLTQFDDFIAKPFTPRELVDKVSDFLQRAMTPAT